MEIWEGKGEGFEVMQGMLGCCCGPESQLRVGERGRRPDQVETRDVKTQLATSQVLGSCMWRGYVIVGL